MSTDEHLDRIVNAYRKFKDDPGFARVATIAEIQAKEGSLLSYPLSVAPDRDEPAANGKIGGSDLADALNAWLTSAAQVRLSLAAILEPKTAKGRR